jgi:hypothetical protein
MSDKTPLTNEQRKINRRSFYVGIAIAMAIFIIYIILYFAGIIH